MRIELTIAAAVGSLLAACSGENVAQPPPPPVNWSSFQMHVAATGPSVATAKERALAEGYVAALASPGFAGLARFFDDDSRFAFPGREDARGRDPIVHAHEVLFGAFDQRSFVTTRVWRTASEQAVEWTMSGVQDRDWLSAPATQKPVTVKGLTLFWTKDDGTVSECHAYFDLAVVKALLGVGPKLLASVVAPPMPSGPPQTIDRAEGEADNVAVVRTSLDALENDESAYVATMTDDVEVHALERADPARGKEAARAYFKGMHKAISQFDTTIDNGWAAGQFAIVEYTIDGEQVGPIGWIPPQRDKIVRLHVADVDEIRDGKIARVWRYDNPGEIAQPGP
jgi:ketosteroid isomerase-like protein